MADLPRRVGGGRRRGYLDWLRGVAVLIMIEGHLRDSWTQAPDRESLLSGWATIVGGIGGGPLFLLLAGAAASMAAGARFRRTGNASAAARSVMRRGLEIFALAFLFRLQAVVLGGGSLASLLKVDILNIMGPSIVAAAAIWSAFRTTRGRLAALGVATVTIAALTPVIRGAPLLAPLPDPLEAYFRPVGRLSNFVFLPTAAFVLAGGFLGVLIDAARDAAAERRLNVRFAAAGTGLAAAAYALSWLPSPYQHSSFWTTSPAYFFMRLGLLVLAIAVAFAWEARPGGETKWSPLRQLGRTSLFIYWIHVEMIYGVISAPLHRSLTLGQTALAYVLFTLFLLACSILKDRVVALWRNRQGQTAAAGA